MSNTDHYVDVADAIVAKLKAMTDPKFTDVYYGDQTIIPMSPAAVVEPGGIERTLEGINIMTVNAIIVTITVYHASIAETQITKRDCDLDAQKVVDELHSDTQMGDTVIFGYCTKVDSGYSMKGGALQYATRIEWEGTTKTMIGA